MASEKDPKIFVFTQITPQDVKYSLDKFVKLANEHGHFVLMSTDLPVGAWKLPLETTNLYWVETPSDNLYLDSTLISVLIQELKPQFQQINFQNHVKDISVKTVLAGNYTIEAIALQLKTIDQIKIFVRSLITEKLVISEEIIHGLIERITKNKQDLIGQWFNTLNEKEKETLISLSIFDGLYDDQFFNAVEKVVDESWKARGSVLTGVDYHNLDALLNFFNIEEIDEKTQVIRSRFSNQRLEFFKAIWFSHRRQLLSSLPVLIHLIKDSVYRPFSNWELYGVEERRTRLQEVVSHSLSDIGIIHFPAVENVFLKLASDESIEVQEITANALARWRKYGLEDQLFEVLNKWQGESRVREIIQELVEIRKSKSEIPSEAFIRSTIVLTLGYASEYDRPNELSERLVVIFNDISKDDNLFVRERFIKITLPQLTRNHLLQLRTHLFELTRYGDFVHPIAIGIASAYNDHPEHVEKVINEWLDYCQSNTNKRSRGSKTTHRDMLLITIILTLSEIEYQKEFEFNIEKAYAIICKLQADEFHEPVEKWYIKFIFRQIEINASKISHQILPVLENLSYEERPALIKFFVQIYIKQRRQLKGGEEIAYFNSAQLPIWIDKDRPFTEIERTMQAWLISDNVTGQQIAIDTLYEFTSKLELSEIEHIESVKERRKKTQEKEKEIQPVKESRAKISNFEPTFATKVISLMTLSGFSPTVKLLLNNLLPILVHKKLSEAKKIKIIADKLKRNGSTELNVISSYLEKFPRILSDYSLLLALSILVSIGIVILIIALTR